MDAVRALDPDTLIRPGLAAQMIGISYSTIWKWANHGEGPAFTIVGTERRYRLGDVIAWQQASKTGGGGGGL